MSDMGRMTLVVVVGSCCCCLTLVVVGQWLLKLDMVISRFFSVGLSIASAFGDMSSGAFHNFSLFLLPIYISRFGYDPAANS